MRGNLAIGLAFALLGMFGVVGCGGGGSSLGGSSGTSGGGNTAQNVQAVTVDTGPPVIANSQFPAINTLFTSVTICAPGSTTNCQTIDHIQVDTGSSGLRIMSSLLTLSLPQQKDASNNPVVECTKFVDGYSWGSVRTADIKIAGESAAGVAIQDIGDTAFPTVPSDCSMSGSTQLRAEDTVPDFGANGILGVGPFISDCGQSCTVAQNGIYFTCPAASACGTVPMPEPQQVSNPVAFFATDNNGVIIELPAVAAAGSAAVSGSLIFGIGTQGNNGLGSATVYMLGGNGNLTTQYKGTALTGSFIDSGSNAYYFPDTITVCPNDNTSSAPGFYCPASTLNLSATIQGTNTTSAVVSFSVANANSLFGTNATIAALTNLAAPSGSATSGSGFDGTNSFDWGLPFYFGRHVATAIDTRNTAAGMGPYFAF